MSEGNYMAPNAHVFAIFPQVQYKPVIADQFLLHHFGHYSNLQQGISSVKKYSDFD